MTSQSPIGLGGSSTGTQPLPLSPRQEEIRAAYDQIAPTRRQWIARNRYFYETDNAHMRFLVPPGARILEIGCGEGHLMAALAPARGVGIDVSAEMIRLARDAYPRFEWHIGNAEDPAVLQSLEGPFDFIILSDTIGLVEDCDALLKALHACANPSTRLIVAYYSQIWEPLLHVAEAIGQKMPQVQLNYLSTSDIANLLHLADYEVVGRDWRQLVPKHLLGFGPLVNRLLAPLPFIRRLCLRNYVVARPEIRARAPAALPSVTVVVPCRNERGNIENAVRRLPDFAPDMEVIYVEGHSHDGTFEECERVRGAYPGRDIKVMRQDGKGKGDAVRKGFGAARGEVVMILDADLTVAPEDLPKFYQALVTGRGEFINGTRMVYPKAGEAMRFLNNIANRAFAIIFSYLLNQRFTDTLCGTKVLWRRDYEKIVRNRGYFGDFDPFGDFDLLFGAAKLNLKIVEIPIRYASRAYGETQISRFRHGWMLLRMVVFAWRKLKAF
jgi:2-polyprenyl-3-methyl-5-hydroxy-6-metoxy-1,4-benzoquinol methylase